MEKKKLQQHISHLEKLLQNFREVKARGKETNSNKERARSISEIEELVQNLEDYMRNNEELLQQMTGKEIELAREVDWNDVIRPSNFEEDLKAEISKLKKKAF